MCEKKLSVECLTSSLTCIARVFLLFTPPTINGNGSTHSIFGGQLMIHWFSFGSWYRIQKREKLRQKKTKRLRYTRARQKFFPKDFWPGMKFCHEAISALKIRLSRAVNAVRARESTFWEIFMVRWGKRALGGAFQAVHSIPVFCWNDFCHVWQTFYGSVWSRKVRLRWGRGVCAVCGCWDQI